MANHTCFSLDIHNYYIEKTGEKPYFTYDLMKRKEHIVLFIGYCPFCGDKLGDT